MKILTTETTKAEPCSKDFFFVPSMFSMVKAFLIPMLCLLASGFAVAAPPQKVTAIYEATRNGQPFATVTETFLMEGEHYRLESLTKGIGVYALFGVRRMSSVGEVTEEGLRPARFEQQQGDKKPVTADFDWAASKLTMKNKQKVVTADLLPDTQDLASFAYQFMFRPPVEEFMTLPITTGKRLRTYPYRTVSKEEMLESVLGGLKTLHLTVVTENGGDEEKELWLASDKHFVPAKIVMRDENGARIEQVLTSLKIE